MTERIESLKEKLFAMEEEAIFLERLFLLKQGYEKYHDKPASLRYALTLDEILSGMSVVIDPDDLIAGRVKETIPTDEEEETIEEIAAYYQEVCPEAVQAPRVSFEDWAYSGKQPPPSRNAFTAAAIPSWFNTFGHLTVSWETLLRKGMSGIMETARQTAAGIEAATGKALDQDLERRKKLEFLEAVTLSCDAVIKFAERYVDTLNSLAESEEDETKKTEFLKTRDILKRVPAYPASTFREALQSVWFLDLIMHQVCGARDYTPGRMDQYLYQYYKHDIEHGVISRDEAIELLQNFFIHTVEISGLTDHTHGSGMYNYTTTVAGKRSLCVDSVQYLVLAGQTPRGKDAVNQLSSVMLDAIDEIRTKSPTVIIRYHEGIDRDFWLKACDMMARSFNNIGIYNDKTVIKAFAENGVKPADAINYSHYGCCNPAIPGKDAQIREDQRNLTKILELALNDGFDPVAGMQRGPHTGKVEEFETYDQLMAAFKSQMDEDIARTVKRMAARFESYIADRPFSFESVLLEGCVEEAMDCNDPRRNPSLGGPGYLHLVMHGGGLATTSDSLAAIKKMVYEESEISLPELKKALDENYEGHEMLRLKLANKCPKFGNDDDYVDSIAAEIGREYCSRVISHGKSEANLGDCWPTLYTYHRYRSCGLETGATPDGRKAFEPVSENQSPVNGKDNKGISALINSLSKLDGALSLSPGGGLTVNMHPTALMVEDGAKVVSDFYETYFDKGGLYIQLNVIDRDTLLDAKKHPEKHRELLVRVTGYSAYFVSLSPESQDNIIARYAHAR